MASIDFAGASPRLDRLAGFLAKLNVFRLPPSVVVATISINLLGLALPLVILQIYDRVLTNQSYNTLAWLIGGLAVVVAVETLLRIVRSHLLSWFTIQAAYLSDVQAVDRILSLPVHEYEKESAVTWMEKFDALEQYNSFASSHSRLALVDIPFFVLYIGVIYMVAGELALVVVAVLLVFTLLFVTKTKKFRSILMARAELDQRRYDFIGETLAGIESVKAMAMEPQMQRRLERLQNNASAIAYRKNLLNNDLTTTTSFMVGTMMVAVVTAGAALVIDGTLSIGALACTTLLTSRLAQLTVRCIPVLLERQNSHVASERARGLLEIAENPISAVAPIAPIDGGVRLKNVVFAYGETAATRFTIEDLTIRPGETIGIKGGQSSGKSTLLKLIAGEILPRSGAIYIDGEDLHGKYRTHLQKHMRFVRNEPLVFQGTILDNITMFETGAAVLKARSTARLLGLEKAINRLPNGFNTMIGAGASTVLPAGMLQQIMIARAIAAEPKILLFDEANSSLDISSDKELIESLTVLKGGMTQVLVTNRPSLLKIADRVFEVRGGRLLASTPSQHAGPPPAK